MINIEDVVLAWNSETDMSDEDVAYCEQNLEDISRSSHTDHKWVTHSTVYKDKSTGKYYEAWEMVSNTGYWGDPEKCEEGCHEVAPKEIINIIWVKVNG